MNKMFKFLTATILFVIPLNAQFSVVTHFKNDDKHVTFVGVEKCSALVPHPIFGNIFDAFVHTQRIAQLPSATAVIVAETPDNQISNSVGVRYIQNIFATQAVRSCLNQDELKFCRIDARHAVAADELIAEMVDLLGLPDSAKCNVVERLKKLGAKIGAECRKIMGDWTNISPDVLRKINGVFANTNANIFGRVDERNYTLGDAIVQANQVVWALKAARMIVESPANHVVVLAPAEDVEKIAPLLCGANFVVDSDVMTIESGINGHK